MNESVHLSAMLHNAADTQLKSRPQALLGGLGSPDNSQKTMNMPGCITEWLLLEEGEEGPNTVSKPCLEIKVEVTY